jgi:glutaredoxin
MDTDKNSIPEKIKALPLFMETHYICIRIIFTKIRNKMFRKLKYYFLLLTIFLLMHDSAFGQTPMDSTLVIIYGPNSCFYTNKLKYELELIQIPFIHKNVKDLNCLEEMWEVMKKNDCQEFTIIYPLVLLNKEEIYLRPTYAKIKRKIKQADCN